MGYESSISWTNHTFNPWIGCTKVSVGPRGACVNCYAERDNNRRKWVDGWGPGVPRRRTKTWDQPRKWNREAAILNRPARVFVASLADIFDNEVPDEWRADLWTLMLETPYLEWLPLTKRIGNAEKMLPSFWPMPNVGLMATIATQEEWDRDWPKLASTPATWRGISAEPLLGPIDMRLPKRPFLVTQPDWVITGGESGGKDVRRTTDPQWFRDLRDQCVEHGIPFHFKQWGGGGVGKGGRVLDGQVWDQIPGHMKH